MKNIEYAPTKWEDKAEFHLYDNHNECTLILITEDENDDTASVNLKSLLAFMAKDAELRKFLEEVLKV